MLTERNRKMIEHALGLTPRNGKRRRWAYRNYYAAGKDTQANWEAMIKEGSAVLVRVPKPYQPYPIYMVTPKGIEAAGLTKYVPRHVLP